jgi:A49-like RNA polymerase I associated factor
MILGQTKTRSSREGARLQPYDQNTCLHDCSRIAYLSVALLFAVYQNLFGVGASGDHVGTFFADLCSAGDVMVDAALGKTQFPPSNHAATELADVYPLHGIIPQNAWEQLSGWHAFLLALGKNKKRYLSFFLSNYFLIDLVKHDRLFSIN